MLAWGAAVLGLALTPGTAHAATLAVTPTLTSLTVSGPNAGDTVTAAATITNTGDVPAYGVQVYLWRSRDPIENLPTLRQSSASTQLWGTPMPQRPGPYVLVTNSVTALAPGDSRQVTLHATLGELGFDTRGAAYAFGVQVVATQDMSSAFVPVGQARTFVAVPTKSGVPITSIVLLTASPTKLVDNLFRSDELVTQLSGRLENLLTVAARPGMSWLIDPALLDEVRDMADGYQVADGTTTKPGTGSDVAAAWLAEFDELDPAAGGRTLFASPDVNGARVAADQQVVPRAQTAAERVAGIEGLPLIVLPAGTSLQASTFDFLATAADDEAIDAVIANNATRAGALQSAPSGGAEADDDRPLVLAVSAEVPGAGETPAVERRQLALATAVIAGGRGQARLLTTLSDVAKDEEATTSWIRRRTLGELLDSEPTEQPATFTSVKPARLSKSQFADLTRLEGDFAAYSDLVPTSVLTEQAAAALSRGAASAWVGNANGFGSHLDGLVDLVGAPAVARSVVLHATPRFLMSSRTNEFPVTVTNQLTEVVRAKVVFETDNPQRLTVPPSEVVTVPPGQSVTVNVRPEAAANGLVVTHAHAATANGHRVTPDTTIIVEVTDLGVVAWIIVGVSGLVLVGATAWRIRQVRRRLAAENAGTPA